ncbi:MAG: dihydrolipoamide acetyltransferase family protein [Anaerolineaceae bacterium]|nr:dihydrolipoamide acetyltransferase family protein [Anaerolineaceae bacterium]
MADTVTMPKLGFDMAEGTLVRWVKTQGETINKGDVLAEIETDKATVEVESGFSGLVYKTLVDQGTVVPVGSPIAIIAAPDEKVVETVQAAPKNTAEKTGPVKPSEQTGQATTTAGIAQAPAAPITASEPTFFRASPLAKKMAVEQGIDLRKLSGSGPDGRIVRKDVEAILAAAKTAAAPAAVVEAVPVVQTPAAPAAVLPGVSLQPAAWVPGEIPADETIPLPRLRTAIGRRMTESKQQIPHFYVTHDYDVAELMHLRTEINQLLPEGQKISINDFIIKAVALCLRQFPNLNTSLAGKDIIRHGHVNVGVAVSVEGGLLTIVCKDAVTKPLRLISSEMKAMIGRARQSKVRPEDIEGSTFSISNMGMYDVENFTAIINPPEVAILAVGAVRQTPVIVDGEIRVGTRMKATISADHRATDGAEAAQFMQLLAAYLEEPMKLLVY